VLATVVNNRFPGRLTTDAGAKALTLNVPHAGVIGEPDMDYNAGSDEFGSITFKEARKTWKMGDRMELVVPHCDPVVNLYDYIYGIRNDRVESAVDHGTRTLAIVGVSASNGARLGQFLMRLQLRRRGGGDGHWPAGRGMRELQPLGVQGVPPSPGSPGRCLIPPPAA
jgi:hypothetical protein